MITTYYRGRTTKTLTTIKKKRSGSWIHVVNPTESEREVLIDEYGIDEGLLLDALDFHEVPRYELVGENWYIFVRVVSNEVGGGVATVPMLFIITTEAFITVVTHGAKDLQPFLNGKIDFFTTDPATLFFKIFKRINNRYQYFVNGINRGVRKVSVNVDKVTNEELVQFVRLEETLQDFVSSLIPMNAVLENILARKLFRLGEDDRDLVEDLSLSLEQLIRLCTSNTKTIQSVRNAYSSIMTNKLNRTIKMLTTITIILTVPTMIAGLFGMNVALPFNGADPAAFWLIVGVALLVSVLVFWMFGRDR